MNPVTLESSPSAPLVRLCIHLGQGSLVVSVINNKNEIVNKIHGNELRMSSYKFNSGPKKILMKINNGSVRNNPS